MLLGLRTALYRTPDIAAGKLWYMKVLGFPPYFDQPFYVGFNVGGFELGAEPRADIQDVGEGVRVADVLDPWGNVFGIIENPNFKLPLQT